MNYVLRNDNNISENGEEVPKKKFQLVTFKILWKLRKSSYILIIRRRSFEVAVHFFPLILLYFIQVHHFPGESCNVANNLCKVQNRIDGLILLLVFDLVITFSKAEYKRKRKRWPLAPNSSKKKRLFPDLGQEFYIECNFSLPPSFVLLFE